MASHCDRITLNQLLKFNLLCLLLFSTTSQADDNKQAAVVLDNLHHFAAKADWDNYFSLYKDNAIFIGTDANAYWNMAQFSQYARPTKGWNYTLIERKMIRHDDVIVFDELLDNISYGVSRGTGPYQSV